MLDFLISFFSDYGYIAVFAMLLLCGLGVPVPEDVSLVSGGVIAGLELANPHIMVAVGMAGVLIGDSTMYLGGRLLGYRLQRLRFFRRILPPRRFAQVQRKFKQYGLGLLFVARFLPGLRSPIFMVAGMSRRISYPVFILMDGFAAAISVPVWVYLGFFFADNLDVLMVHVHDAQKMIYLAIGTLVVVIAFIVIKRKIHARMQRSVGDEEPLTSPPPAAPDEHATEPAGLKEPLSSSDTSSGSSSGTSSGSSSGSS